MTARRVALVAMLALAEAALISPLVRALVPLPPALGAPGTVGLVWLVLVALAVQWQLMAQRNVSLSMQRILMGGWLIVLIAVIEADIFASITALQPDLLTMLPGFLIGLILWWRGMSLGTSELRPRDADLHLQIGLLILLLYGFATLFNRDLDILIYLTAFFFGTLTALPLANLEYTHLSSIGRRVPMTRSWWGWVLALGGGALLLGLILTALMTGRSVASLLMALLTVLLFPIALLMTLIPQSLFDALAALLRRLGDMLGNLPQFGNDAQQAVPESQGGATINIPPEINFAIGLLAFAALVALVIYLMRRAERSSSDPQVQASDTEGSIALAAAAGGATSAGIGLAGLRRWLAVVTIRRLYVRASREAERRGFRRAPAQTPYDFLPELQRAFPSAEDAAKLITDAYVAAHYGEVPDSPQELNALKAAWGRMRATRASA